MIDYRRLAVELAGVSVRDALGLLENVDGEVRILRVVGANTGTPAGPFHDNRINLHVDQDDIVRDVSQG